MAYEALFTQHQAPKPRRHPNSREDILLEWCKDYFSRIAWVSAPHKPIRTLHLDICAGNRSRAADNGTYEWSGTCGINLRGKKTSQKKSNDKRKRKWVLALWNLSCICVWRPVASMFVVSWCPTFDLTPYTASVFTGEHSPSYSESGFCPSWSKGPPVTHSTYEGLTEINYLPKVTKSTEGPQLSQ